MDTSINTENKSKAFKRAKANINGKLKEFFLNSYTHYTVPGINLVRDDQNESWDVISVLGKFQDYPYGCELPKPFLPPIKLKREVLIEEDPALEIITMKSHMKDDMNRIKNYYLKHKNALKMPKKYEIKWDKEQKTTSVPRYIAEVAETVELDPDPYFSGTYNWYYTGGTLNNISYGEENILVFPYSGDLVATLMSPQEDFIWKPNLKIADKCQLEDTLYELRHNFTSNSCRIIGRFKNHCTIYNLSLDTSQLELLLLHNQESSIPFISADLSQFKPNEYCTVNVERLVSIWDLTKMRPITSGSIQNTKCLSDKWGSVRYQSLNSDTLIYTDRCCLHYIDTRIPIERPALSLCPKANLEICESLCFEYPSSNSFCPYVGSYHSFLLCDSRSPDHCVQQKWTHQFKGAPLLCNIVQKGNQEMIVLASHLQREKAIILNDWINEENSRSYSTPFTPPSILETLRDSRKQGKCLDPSMKLRLGLSAVGCTLIPDNKGHTFLFTQNSIGDIFYQGITHEEKLDKYSTENNEAVKILESWEDAILNQTETIIPLAFSEKADMSSIFKNFNRSKFKYTPPEKPDEVINPSWQEPLEKISSYVDLLAPELLAVWEVTDGLVPPLTAAPHQKVLNWLETSEAGELTQTTTNTQDIEILPTPVGTQEPISVSQQEVVCLEESDNFQQMYLPKVKTTRKPKEVKKRKYVPGF